MNRDTIFGDVLQPFVGLVDYPDEDEDGEEDVASGDGVTDSSEPSAKRAKLAT